MNQMKRSLMMVTSLLMACGTSAGAEKAAVDVADVFLIALRDARWNTAFHRLGPGLQRTCGGDPHELAQRVIDRFEFRITDWRLRVESASRDLVVLGGEVERGEHPPMVVGLVVEDHGDQWRIGTLEADGTEVCRPAP